MIHDHLISTKEFREEILFLADRAFQRRRLIDDNAELKNLLRGLLLSFAMPPDLRPARDGSPFPGWALQRPRLEALGVLTPDEARIINERVGVINGKGNSTDR